MIEFPRKFPFSMMPLASWSLLWLLSCYWFVDEGKGQSGTLTCVSGLNISVDAQCEVWISVEMLLTNPIANPNDYTIYIESADGSSVPNPITTPWINQTLTVTVTQLSSGNSCWTTLSVQDALKPTIDSCPPLSVNCRASIDSLPFPTASDNCDAFPTVSLLAVQVLQPDICTPPAQVARIFQATDTAGNHSDTCYQLVTLNTPPAPLFPQDVTWTCTQYQANPQLIDPLPFPQGSGVPQVDTGGFCPYTVGWADEVIALCGNTFRIIRSWSIMDWCSGQLITTDSTGTDNTQLIAITDTQAPSVIASDFQLVVEAQAANNSCVSYGFIPPPLITDCQSQVQVQIFTPIGEAIYVNGNDGSMGGHVPPPGLSTGTYTITYLAIDACGNISAQSVQATVVDLTPPVVVCDALTEVTLGQDGTATIPAAALDDGSHDNCCIDYFEVRRMNDNCNDSTSLTFNPTVSFCCNDALSSPQTVVLRVFDCQGNFNDCMVQVEVSDKTMPVIYSCPADTTISCDFYIDSLAVPLQTGQVSVLSPFGFPNIQDNCLTGIAGATFSINVGNCGVGSIERQWIITDPSGNGPVICEQSIQIEHLSDWVVSFPPDFTGQCGDSLPFTGEPQIFGASCELIGVSYEDQLFEVVADACFKIERTWTVINWCVVGDQIDQETVEQPESVLGVDLDGDGDLDDRTFQDSRTINGVFDLDPDPDIWDGFITAKQIIKLTDTVAPIISCPPEMNVCIYGQSCTDSIMIPLPDVLDCSPEVSFHITSEWGNGQGPWYNVMPGLYPIVFVASDNCGNSSVCETYLRTSDCKPPSPYCLNGMVVTLDNNQHAEAWAWFFNAGSVDNCSDQLVFSFSADTTDQYAEFGCLQLGAEIIEMWVTDEAGNQDYCETILLIQDPNEYCPDALPSIEGIVATEQGVRIAQVQVTLSGDTTQYDTTGIDGTFRFDSLPLGSTFQLSAYRSGDWLNGVSTLDLVLITRHILGIDTLDSPYQLIAADANNSQSITTFDVLQLRRLILYKIDSLAGNTSWRFIPASHVFPPDDPWSFPETVVIDTLSQSIDSLDFIAVKVGDINYTANPELTDSPLATDRTDQPPNILALEATFQYEPDSQEGILRIYTAPQTPPLQALQFCLSFDAYNWQYTGLIRGVADSSSIGTAFVDQGQLLLSWHGNAPLMPGQTLMALRFRANTATQKVLPTFRLIDQWLESVAWDDSQQPYKLQLKTTVIPSEIVFGPPMPNPFPQQTTFSCYLPQTRQLHIRLLDIQGKTIWSFAKRLPPGLHQWTLQAEQLDGPGIYVLVIESDQGEFFVHKLAFLR